MRDFNPAHDPLGSKAAVRQRPLMRFRASAAAQVVDLQARVLGAFRTPVTRARGKVAVAGVRKPAHKRL
jgi:hypothetical protein